MSTHEPQSRLPAGSRAKRFRSEWSPTRRRGQTVAQRCSISVIPGIPMRGARISLLVTRIRIVARRRKGGRRAPHDTYRPSDRRAERAAPGSLAPDGSHRAGRRRPHAGRARSDWCRPRAPKTNLAANRLRGITHVHQFGTFPTFDPLPETKLLHPADDKLAGEPPAQQPI